jgi:hypothetical protein
MSNDKYRFSGRPDPLEKAGRLLTSPLMLQKELKTSNFTQIYEKTHALVASPHLVAVSTRETGSAPPVPALRSHSQIEITAKHRILCRFMKNLAGRPATRASKA